MDWMETSSDVWARRAFSLRSCMDLTSCRDLISWTSPRRRKPAVPGFASSVWIRERSHPKVFTFSMISYGGSSTATRRTASSRRIPSRRNCSPRMVFPLPEAPVTRYGLPGMRPLRRIRSSPGTPVETLLGGGIGSVALIHHLPRIFRPVRRTATPAFRMTLLGFQAPPTRPTPPPESFRLLGCPRRGTGHPAPVGTGAGFPREFRGGRDRCSWREMHGIPGDCRRGKRR